MEDILSTVLSSALVLVVVVLIRHWGGPSVARRPAVAGVLVAPATPFATACLAHRRDPSSCLSCGLCQQCWGLRSVPAAEEIEGRPGGIADRSRASLDPVVNLERVERLLKAADGLLSRFLELLNVLPVQQIVHAFGRLLQLLLARASG